MLISVRVKGDEFTYAEIDDADAPLVCGPAWRLSNKGYAYRNEGARRETILMHRQILGLRPGGSRGRSPEGDHINRNKLDNRRLNLRVVTRSGNNQNRRWPVGKSGYRGVVWDRSHSSWRAILTLDGKQHSFGRFDDPAEAARVVAMKRAEMMPCSEEAWSTPLTPAGSKA